VIRGRLNYRPVRESTVPEPKETEDEASPAIPGAMPGVMPGAIPGN
jgi:hypothetical protein